MKKTSSILSISSILQLLGVLINGIEGNSLELIAYLIDAIYGKSSTKVFLQKFFIIILSQVLINWIFADYSMTIDMTIWLVEKNYKMVWTSFEMWMVVGNIFNLLKIKNTIFTSFLIPIIQKNELVISKKKDITLTRIENNGS